MSAITIISATNRPGSFTKKIAQYCGGVLMGNGIDCRILSLEDVPQDIAFSETFGKRTPGFEELIHSHIANSNKFLFVIPEYNGSFPGILKTFIDAIPPRYWNFKKAGLIGVSDGRAGNLRGIEQFTLVLNYLKTTVFYNKLPISSVGKLFDDKSDLFDEATLKTLDEYLDSFLKF